MTKLRADDMDTEDILLAIDCLPDPSHPSTQLTKRAAAEIRRLQQDLDSLYLDRSYIAIFNEGLKAAGGPAVEDITNHT